MKKVYVKIEEIHCSNCINIISNELLKNKKIKDVSINGDIAANSSDVLLMSDNLDKIIELLNISSKTIKIIKENLFWAFFYNICMIPIAIGLLKPLGISISPMLASLAMMVSSLCVVFNSLRLRR